MFKKLILTGLLCGSSLFGSSVHWSYSGHEGPEYWGDLSDKFKMCKIGKNQSPINIKSSDIIEAQNLAPITFEYSAEASNVINNGHTIKVNFGEGSKIEIDGKNFYLKQFHFHTPSENAIEGKLFPMEAHLVHVSKKGEIAVVGVMFEVGTQNKTLEKIIAHMPTKVGEKKTLSITHLNAYELLPENKNYYRFNGSLTTPPCSEGVRWFVLKTPVTISKEQLDKFSEVMGKNNRPLQNINARKILK
jgi:carbonic anhydrase